MVAIFVFLVHAHGIDSFTSYSFFFLLILVGGFWLCFEGVMKFGDGDGV
jgi:hypothetical protein